MVKSDILNSTWVEPNKNGWGYKLKKDAPESVRHEFEAFQRNLKNHRNDAPSKANIADKPV